MNTINQAIDLIQKSGIDVTSETQEADEEYIITLKVKNKLSKIMILKVINLRL